MLQAIDKMINWFIIISKFMLKKN